MISTTTHIVSGYDAELSRLTHDLTDLGTLVSEMVPVAQDLRSIISATRIASDLERVGDLAEGIARRAMIINEEKRIDIAKSVHRMGKQVRKQ